MAVRRPLKSITGGLQEMTDSELEYLSYMARVAFANHQVASGSNAYGAVYVSSSGGTSIGSLDDTKRTQGVSSTGDGGYTGGDGDAGYGPDEGESGEGPPTSHDEGDYPATPSTGTTTATTYNYRQNQDNPSEASNNLYDSASYLVYDSDMVKVEGVENNIADTIITDCLTAMKDGDEVGSFRIATSTPDSGGAGTWEDRGTFYIDTTYSGTQNTYKLYLKKSLTTPPGSAINPVGWNSSGHLRQRGIGAADTLIVDILCHVLKRKYTSHLKYEVVSSNVSARNRGTIVDTRLNSQTTSYHAPGSDQYITKSTPSGSAVAHATKYFLIGAS